MNLIIGFGLNVMSVRASVVIVSRGSDTTAGASAAVLHTTTCNSRCTFACAMASVKLS